MGSLLESLASSELPRSAQIDPIASHLVFPFSGVHFQFGRFEFIPACPPLCCRALVVLRLDVSILVRCAPPPRFFSLCKEAFQSEKMRFVPIVYQDSTDSFQ